MLYLVATPIGNLGDITLRALETLRSVDFIASEDTRTTGVLLRHYDIAKPQIAFHEHNEQRAGERILGLLRSGSSVALVTDAGTPGISDPGYSLVRRALDADVEVTMIPGPAALVIAVVLAGLPLHSFTFRGFPPRKSGARQRWLAIDKDSPHTLVFYESPLPSGRSAGGCPGRLWRSARRPRQRPDQTPRNVDPRPTLRAPGCGAGNGQGARGVCAGGRRSGRVSG
jgi:16S rRNA (cytidine1402-2'-O)-methyltransferase